VRGRRAAGERAGAADAATASPGPGRTFFVGKTSCGRTANTFSGAASIMSSAPSIPMKRYGSSTSRRPSTNVGSHVW